MAFTLNAGEFDLGAGFIGRGTILAGEAYSVGTATTGVQGILNTSGLEGLSYNTGENIGEVHFRESTDPNLSGTIAQGTTFSWIIVSGSYSASYVPNNARLHLSINTTATGGNYQGYASYINTSTSANGETLVVPSSSYAVGNSSPFRDAFVGVANWRFLARDHATAITHYPSTATQGSIFAAACVNSSTQWGLWAAGAVGNRNGYFNQRHGDFAIVLLQNGANTYFSVMTPQTENSSTRNDSPLRNFNIVPAAGQTTVNDQMSELVLLKNTGSFFSSPLGTVPGLYYIDPNKTNFDSYTIGMAIDIDPDPLSTFEGRDRAIIVARWGLDATISISNSGNVFTAGGSPNRRTLENGVRVQFQTSPPSGFSTGADYWVINWNETSYTFNLASTEGGSAVTASSNTSSTIVRKAALIAMRCY